jgi:hypothetical protein
MPIKPIRSFSFALVLLPFVAASVEGTVASALMLAAELPIKFLRETACLAMGIFL